MGHHYDCPKCGNEKCSCDKPITPKAKRKWEKEQKEGWYENPQNEVERLVPRRPERITPEPWEIPYPSPKPAPWVDPVPYPKPAPRPPLDPNKKDEFIDKYKKQMEEVRKYEDSMKKEEENVGGIRFDQGKNRLDLIPPEWLWALGDILTKGAAKYQPRNWEKGMAWSRIVGSALRHYIAFMCGQRYDPETGCHHLGMVAWNFLALMSYDLREIGENDLVIVNRNMLERVRGEKRDDNT